MLTKTRSSGGTHLSTDQRLRGSGQRERPVLLATLAAPLAAAATEFALGCAMETGHPLVIAGFVEVAAGRGATLPAPELDAIVQPAVDQVSSHAICVQVLKVRSPRPLKAILEVADDIDAGLLAFGPDLAKIRPRRYRRAARFLSREARCLLGLVENAAVNV
jgi:hypothetical protein